MQNDPDGHFAAAALGLSLINFAAVGQAVAAVGAAVVTALSSPVVITALVVAAVVVGGVLLYQNYQANTHKKEMESLQRSASNSGDNYLGPGYRNPKTPAPGCGWYCKITIGGLLTGLITYLAYKGNCTADDEACKPPAPTSTPTSTLTPTMTPTSTPTSTPTATPTNTPTDMPTNTPTNTPSNTPTNTPSVPIIPKPLNAFPAIPI